MKELLANKLIQTTWLSIEKRGPKNCELRFKGDINRYLIEAFLQKNSLEINEDKEEESYVTYKKQELQKIML